VILESGVAQSEMKAFDRGSKGLGYPEEDGKELVKDKRKEQTAHNSREIEVVVRILLRQLPHAHWSGAPQNKINQN
jgi:hypothetical protein